MSRYSRSRFTREDIPETNSEAYWFLESVRYHLQNCQDNALLHSSVEQYRALTEARAILVECGRILNAEFKAACGVAA